MHSLDNKNNLPIIRFPNKNGGVIDQSNPEDILFYKGLVTSLFKYGVKSFPKMVGKETVVVAENAGKSVASKVGTEAARNSGNALVETANSILMPGGNIIGIQLAKNPNIRTISPDHASSIARRLIASGAKIVNKPGYKGIWFELPTGGGFGIRDVVSEASLRLGSTRAIDINIIGIPIKNIKY